MSRTRVLALVSVVAAFVVGTLWVKERPQPESVVASPAQFLDAVVLKPVTYSSRSKDFQLHIDPTDRHGCGGASYEMTRDGERVWASALPYTLVRVEVTDSGEVVGFAYSHGVEGFDSGDGSGDFRVVILDSSGKPRLNEATERSPSEFLHQYPNPIGRGLLLDQANDRVIFRIGDPDINRQSESWWIYELSTGKSLQRLRPRERMADAEHVRALVEAKLIEGTPLTLLRWWRFQHGDPQGRENYLIGAHFALVDENMDPVWERVLPRDYIIHGDEQAQDRLRDHVREHSVILQADGKAKFEIYEASKSERVTYRISDRDGEWNVEQIERSPLEVEAYLRRGTSKSVAKEITLSPLQSLGQIQLVTQSRKSPIRGLVDFTFDDRGRIAFIRGQTSEPDAFVLVDSGGDLIREIPLNIEADSNTSGTSCSWISGDRFLLTQAEFGPEKKARGWWLDAAKQTLSPIAGFDSPPVERLVRFSDDGFVALARMRYKYTLTESLCAFDGSGRQIWEIESGSGEGDAELFSPEDIAVTADDQVAVLDNIRNTIQVFDRDGGFVRKIDLKQRWGRRPNYLSGIRALDDGWLIYDFDGSPAYVVADRQGREQRGFTPKLPSGRQLDESYYAIAPDGRLWATDGSAIFRLDQNGVVDRTLGTSPESGALANIAGSALGPNGQLYFVDSRSASVHVFDSSGKPKGVCVIDPADFRHELYDASLSVNDSGEVLLCVDDISSSGRFVQFSGAGEQARSLKLRLDTDSVHYQPGTDRKLALTYETAVFLDSRNEVIREITRRPDGKWLIRPVRASFAPNGSFAILHFGAVSLFEANGDPIRTIAIAGMVGSFPRLTFDGDLVVVGGESHAVI
ncbi:MAG: hypothetical protein AAFU85_14830 [Planctomycetota bacterium]